MIFMTTFTSLVMEGVHKRQSLYKVFACNQGNLEQLIYVMGQLGQIMYRQPSILWSYVSMQVREVGMCAEPTFMRAHDQKTTSIHKSCP